MKKKVDIRKADARLAALEVLGMADATTGSRRWADVIWESREWFELQGGRSRPVGFDGWMRPRQVAWLEANRPIVGVAP